MVGCVCVISVYHDYSGLVDIIIPSRWELLDKYRG